MGYAVYWNETDKRWCGYGVPAYCDAPNCKEEIDRGMSYVCGEPLADQFGCGRYFCTNHLKHVRQPRGDDTCYSNCTRCGTYKRAYKNLSQNHPDWLKHVLTDDSWSEWRAQEPELVVDYAKQLNKLISKS